MGCTPDRHEWKWNDDERPEMPEGNPCVCGERFYVPLSKAPSSATVSAPPARTCACGKPSKFKVAFTDGSYEPCCEDCAVDWRRQNPYAVTRLRSRDKLARRAS
jgi:hypothetical protein